MFSAANEYIEKSLGRGGAHPLHCYGKFFAGIFGLSKIIFHAIFQVPSRQIAQDAVRTTGLGIGFNRARPKISTAVNRVLDLLHN